jgi:hypothetical protein
MELVSSCLTLKPIHMPNRKGGSKAQPQSAVTGRYVTEAYADKHPKTTFIEKKVKSKK